MHRWLWLVSECTKGPADSQAMRNRHSSMLWMV